MALSSLPRCFVALFDQQVTILRCHCPCPAHADTTAAAQQRWIDGCRPVMHNYLKQLSKEVEFRLCSANTE